MACPRQRAYGAGQLLSNTQGRAACQAMAHTLSHDSPPAATSTVLETSWTWIHSVRNIGETRFPGRERPTCAHRQRVHLREQSSAAMQKSWLHCDGGPNTHGGNPRKHVLCVTCLWRAVGGSGFLKAEVRGIDRPLHLNQWQQKSMVTPRGDDAGLTGGPWGPGGPGVSDE